MYFGNNKYYKVSLDRDNPMAVSASKEDETLLTFEGASHRLFIEGRGFDFEKLVVGSGGKAKLFLNNSEHNLYTFLDFEEPRFVYVVSRIGVKDLILQGCRIEEMMGENCIISFLSKITSRWKGLEKSTI